MKPINEILNLPERSSKPRESGITMVIDNGMGVSRAKNMIEEGSELIDYVKLGWCTSLVTPNVQDKVKTYLDAGIPAVSYTHLTLPTKA